MGFWHRELLILFPTSFKHCVPTATRLPVMIQYPLFQDTGSEKGCDLISCGCSWEWIHLAPLPKLVCYRLHFTMYLESTSPPGSIKLETSTTVLNLLPTYHTTNKYMNITIMTKDDLYLSVETYAFHISPTMRVIIENVFYNAQFRQIEKDTQFLDPLFEDHRNFHLDHHVWHV